MEKDIQTLTAERSLEIISGTIEASRKKALNYIGRPLVIWGIFIIICSLAGWYLDSTLKTEVVPTFWLLIVAMGFCVIFLVENRKENRFGNVLGHTIGSIWGAFCIFAVIMAVSEALMHLLAEPLISSIFITIMPISIILLLSMACVISGFVLKNYVIVSCGILAAILSLLAFSLEGDLSGMLIFAFLAFVELVLPGAILLMKSKRK